MECWPESSVLEAQFGPEVWKASITIFTFYLLAKRCYDFIKIKVTQNTLKEELVFSTIRKAFQCIHISYRLRTI